MSTQRIRWRPSRAGILNVYQYEDETLHFADGRLLLRGVNGSGKSTAMNRLELTSHHPFRETRADPLAPAPLRRRADACETAARAPGLPSQCGAPGASYADHSARKADGARP
jgi:hypothetical protein